MKYAVYWYDGNDQRMDIVETTIYMGDDSDPKACIAVFKKELMERYAVHDQYCDIGCAVELPYVDINNVLTRPLEPKIMWTNGSLCFLARPSTVDTYGQDIEDAVERTSAAKRADQL